MKQPALVCVYWEKSLDTLVEVVKLNPCVVITLSALCSDTLAKRIEAVGGKLLPLESVLDESAFARLKQSADQQQQQLQQALTGEDWQAYCAKNGWPPAGLAELLTAQTPTHIPQVLYILEALERCRSHFDLRLVALNEEFTWSAKLLVNWARNHQIPSLHLLHGIGLERAHTVHEVAVADHYAIGSDYSAISLLELGVSEEKIHITGFPAWDVYAELIPRKNALRAETAATYGLDPNLPWITFFPRWASNTSAFMNKDEYHQGVRATMEACKLLWDAGKQFELIIKDRRQNARTGKRMTDALAVTLKLPKQHCHHVTEGMTAFAVTSSLVISAGSNVSIEAAITGVPAVNLLDEAQWLLGPPFPDAGMPELDANGLSAWLASNFDTLDKGCTAGLSPRDFFVGPNGDGQSAHRVATLMLQLAGLA